ncbi:MAG: MBL fold metallo-hydrolase, partial [Ectothiorhodospiraceae bacterium]|nr:MBL fold metallo-hydrolase [Ectothiorhodospiraceae bacterium]
GHITPHIERMLTACDALLVECNHDSALLAAGPYPQALKARVGGRFGHLSNAQTAELLARLDLSRLQHIAALHLSDTNNRPDLAAAAVSAALGCEPDWVTVADQTDGFGWRDLA